MKTYNRQFLGLQFPSTQKFKYQPPLKYTHTTKAKEEIHECPLCGEDNYVTIGRFQIDLMIDMWITRKGFNPIADIYRGDNLLKRVCKNCGIYFYNYRLRDSEEFYQNLSCKSLSNYHPAFRCEYGMATEIIEQIKPKSLFEIGSGDGQFLKRIQHIVPRIIGSEYNTSAANKARARGLEILTQDIGTINEQFDIVCHFEVLEHVFDTKPLMENSVKLLKKGGKLIIGTPDPEGVLAISGVGELNLPPHHHFDFSKASFEWLAKKYNLKIFHYQKSELSYRKYARYVQNLTGKELTQPDIVGFYETQKRFSGHSHMVVFEKL